MQTNIQWMFNIWKFEIWHTLIWSSSCLLNWLTFLPHIANCEFCSHTHTRITKKPHEHFLTSTYSSAQTANVKIIALRQSNLTFNVCKMFSQIIQLNKNGFGNVDGWVFAFEFSSLTMFDNTNWKRQTFDSHQTDTMPNQFNNIKSKCSLVCFILNVGVWFKLLKYSLESAMHLIECVSTGFWISSCVPVCCGSTFDWMHPKSSGNPIYLGKFY